MTDKTVVYTARVPKEVMEIMGDIDKRKVLEGVAKLISEGMLHLEGGNIVTVPSVYTDCEGCPYIENALDMSKFDEVCEYKGLDRQRALDRCAQMLWR